VLLAFQVQEDELDNAIAETQDLIDVHDELIATFSNISAEERARMRSILPESIDIVRLIIDLDTLANRHNISIRTFDVPDINRRATARNTNTTDTIEDSVGSAILTIELEGEYPNFKAFLIDVERSLTLMDVVDLEIEVPDVSRNIGNDQIVYTLGLQSYWIK
jgi:hypothetical protein